LGDLSAVPAVLKGTSVLSGAHVAIGSLDPEELAEDASLEHSERQFTRRMKALTGFG